MTYRKGPSKISDLLGGLLVFRWVEAWRRCAGPVLLKQTKFLGVRPIQGRLCLQLQVPDPMWRQELEYQKADLLARFCRALSEAGVPESGRPVDCLLSAAPGVPFKARNPKQGGNKVRVK